MNAWSKLKTYVGGSPAPANSAALGKRKRSKEDKPPLSPKRAKTAAAEAAHVPTPARLSPVIEETDEDDREVSLTQPIPQSSYLTTIQETTARQTRQATRATIVEAASQTEPPVQDGTGIPEDNRSNSVILGQAVDELIAEMKGKADAENKAASGQKALPATTQAKSKSSSLATAPKATTTSLPKRKFENKPSGWDQLTPASKWDVMPNLRARELLAAHPASSEAIIKAEISEPEYALRDVEIRDALWQIMDEMSGFTKKFFAFECHHKDNVIPEDWFTRLASQTAKIIGCVASDGPSGVDGWHDLFIDPEKRCALICAIIGNILVEQVLQHPFFGANKPFAASSSPSISQLEEKHRNDNGKHTLTLLIKVINDSLLTTFQALIERSTSPPPSRTACRTRTPRPSVSHPTSEIMSITSSPLSGNTSSPSSTSRRLPPRAPRYLSLAPSSTPSTASSRRPASSASTCTWTPTRSTASNPC